MSQRKEEEFAAYIGIDWADEKHDICLQAVGSCEEEFRVLKHRPESIDQWAMELQKRFKGKRLAVCLEQSKGPLIYALMKYDFLVIYPINPQSLAKYRQSFALSHAKDDPTDARLMKNFLNKHREHLTALKADDPQIIKLQHLVEFRKKLAQEKVKSVQQNI